MAKPCTPHLIAQRVQLFELQTANVKFLSGDLKGDTLFCEREYPPLPRAAPAALLSLADCKESISSCIIPRLW